MPEPTEKPVEKPTEAKPAEAKSKPKVEIDVEKSQKQTVEKSVLGKLMLSEYECKDCGAPVLEKEWKSCVKCGGTKASLKVNIREKRKENEKKKQNEDKKKKK